MKKYEQKIKRQKRVRSKMKGNKEKPRLSVFRSNKYIYVQLIDDENGQTILAFSSKNLDIKKSDKNKLQSKLEMARQLGKLVAEKTIERKIKKIIFDRGGYTYHGQVKALAEGAREGGLMV